MTRKRGKKAKASSRSRKPRSRTGARSSFGQKVLVGLSSVLLILCLASITYGFFVRKGDGKEGKFRIQVLNGTGQAGLANDAKRGLLRMGIDVIDVTNADRFDYEESILIARKVDAEVVELGRMLGCKHVIKQVQHDSMADASLILGADYDDLRLDWGN